jgi:hypothetical protein
MKRSTLLIGAAAGVAAGTIAAMARAKKAQAQPRPASFDLPPVAGVARDQAILDHLAHNELDPIHWAPVTSAANGHTAVFQVMTDALKLGGIRITAGAKLQQQIADALGCILLTAKLADLAFQQAAVVIPPWGLPTPGWQPVSMTTAAMIESSHRIDALIAKAGGAAPDQLVQTVGKHWIIDNDLVNPQVTPPGHAMNYGWHFRGATFGGNAFEPGVTPGQRVVQGRGTRHGLDQADDSQHVVLAQLACTLDDNPTSIIYVLQNPATAMLASAQGVLHVLRQPGT